MTESPFLVSQFVLLKSQRSCSIILCKMNMVDQLSNLVQTTASKDESASASEDGTINIWRSSIQERKEMSIFTSRGCNQGATDPQKAAKEEAERITSYLKEWTGADATVEGSLTGMRTAVIFKTFA